MATTVKASEGAAKAGEILNVGAQGKDLAKEAMKVEMPQEANPHEKAEKATPLDVAPKGVSEIKPMDELSKDLVKADAAADDKAKKEKEEADKKADKEKEDKMEATIRAKIESEFKVKAETERKAKLTAAMTKYKTAQKAKTVAATARGSFDAKTLLNLKRELRVMATLDSKKFSEVKKNPKLSVLCAEVEKTLHPKAFRAQVRAELKALASEDMEAAEEAKKELEFVAPEILLEEPVELKAKDPLSEGAAAPMPPAMSDAEGGEAGEGAEGGDAEAAAKAEKEKADADAALAAPAPLGDMPVAEAMQTEWLASIDTLKGERVEMSLYGESSENPYWNVIVDGEPLARIHLGDQEDAQVIRASFVTEAYADNLGKLIGEMGVKKILPMVKARLFAHKVDQKEVMARIRDKAKLEAKAEFDGKIGTLRQDFLRAVNTVLVAADKNFYQEEGGHALKGGLFNSLIQAGLNEQHAVWAVEAGFEEAPTYFAFVTDKAIEMMDMPQEARASLEKTITASGKISIEAAAQPKEDNLVDRLVQSSVNAIAMGGDMSGENLDGIRSKMGLKSTRR